MEDTMEQIRATSRNLLILNRQQLRQQQSDVQRSVSNNVRISISDIEAIAMKLKTQSSITLEELQTLKNGLIDNENHIETVLKINGALRGLVREVIGHEVKKQCAAAGCLCNLALGDSRACLAVTKAAGPYLIAALDNLTVDLAVTCAWTLGNLAGSGARTCELLTGQGAVTKLVLMLQSPIEDKREAALYALVHFTYQLKDDLRPEYVTHMLSCIPMTEIDETTTHLLFLLSCHKQFVVFELSEIFLQKLLEKLKSYMIEYTSNPKVENIIVYMFRFIANINIQVVYMLILQYFIVYDMVASIKNMLGVPKVNDSLLWMLGNMYSLCNEHLFFTKLLSIM